MKKLLILMASVAAAVVLFLLLFSAKEDRIRVGVSIQNLKDDYHKAMVTSMIKAATEKNIDLVVFNADNDPNKTVEHINTFLDQGVNGIIIGTTNEEAPMEAVQKAHDKNVFVLSIDQYVENADAYFGVDDYQYGFVGGSIAGNWLNQKEASGTIADVISNEGTIQVALSDYRQLNSIANRIQGYKEGLKQIYLGDYPIDFVYQADAAFETEGFQLAEHVLSNWPDTSIFLCINDSSALGVYKACQLDKRHTVNNTCIVGLNAVQEALEEIAKDTMYRGTVDIGPGKKGEEIMTILLNLIKGESNGQSIFWFDIKPVTIENISEYI